jgi:hypothetical protein
MTLETVVFDTTVVFIIVLVSLLTLLTMMWCEEHLWNLSVLQRVCQLNLVFGFPTSLKTNARITPEIMPWQLPYTSLHISYSLNMLSNNAIYQLFSIDSTHVTGGTQRVVWWYTRILDYH